MKFESGRAAVLSVHGTADFSLETTVFDAAAYEEAIELPAKLHGECTTFEDGRCWCSFGVCMLCWRCAGGVLAVCWRCV
jgi:hypothetical protein